MFDFSNESTKSKYDNNLNKLVICKVKDKTAGVAVKEFVGLKSKKYLFLEEDNSEHKKGKAANKNVVATTSHNKYKDVLLTNKCIRYSMNRTQSKDHRIGTCKPIVLTLNAALPN